MAVQVDRKAIDDFCPRLFRMLDDLGLLPLHLSAKPNEFEKHPRLLFGSIQRYNDVEAGFKEWESRVLRETPRRKEACYADIEALRQWMVAHSEVFTKKVNIQHLSTSLYARLFQYLYPRRVLANAYCQRQKGRAEVLDKFNRFVDATDLEAKQAAQAELQRMLDAEFVQSVEPSVSSLAGVYADDWEAVIADSKKTLMDYAAYYRKVLANEQVPIPPGAGIETETDEDSEEE